MSSINRLPSLDLLRSAAILSMVVYHFLWDLETFGIAQTLSVMGTAERIWQIVTAGTFLMLVGVSFAISQQRRRAAGASVLRRSMIRGGIVLACAALVSAGTYAMEPETYVRFGVLHLIGVGIVLLPFVARFGRWNIFIGIMLILPNLLNPPNLLNLPNLLSIPLGFPPPWFASVDYFPLFPWLGVILLGYGCSPWIIQAAHTLDHTLAPYDAPLTPVLWPGRNALLIYMIHQPLLIAAIWTTMK